VQAPPVPSPVTKTLPHLHNHSVGGKCGSSEEDLMRLYFLKWNNRIKKNRVTGENYRGVECLRGILQGTKTGHLFRGATIAYRKGFSSIRNKGRLHTRKGEAADEVRRAAKARVFLESGDKYRGLGEAQGTETVQDVRPKTTPRDEDFDLPEKKTQE